MSESPAPPLILVTNGALISHHDTAPKAQREAHRWLRRSDAGPGDWVTILDAATGETRKRYMVRHGCVERMQ